MDPRWDDRAACKRKDPALWFPLDGASSAVGQAICGGCPVRSECLVWAVEQNEKLGIWGGLSFDRRKVGRRLWQAGDALGFSSWLARVLAGEDMSEANDGVCRRCGAPVRAGPIPEDRNSPGATCGKVGTYNRGCRCDPCKAVKADAKAVPPRAGRRAAR